jgi:hypothetical protein
MNKSEALMILKAKIRKVKKLLRAITKILEE